MRAPIRRGSPRPTAPVPGQWECLIAGELARPRAILRAETYERKPWPTHAKPALFRCSDGNRYVVKGRQAGMVPGNDHLVAQLGQLIKAPVPQVRLVNVPQLLLGMQPELDYFKAGLAHGSHWHEACTDRECILHFDVEENRQRFAALAVLFGWVRVEQDHQFVYTNNPPELVLSVDHGHCFPDGPNWTEQSLQSTPAAYPDIVIREACGLAEKEIRRAVQPLRTVTDRMIARVVAGPPENWNYPMRRRVAMARYLADRRDHLVQHYGEGK